MEKVQADKAAKQPYEEPAYGIDGVIAHLNLLKSETEAIFKAPPPKKEKQEPPKNEPMSEDKKEGEKVEQPEAPAPEDELNDAFAAMKEEDIDMNNEQ